MTDLERLQDTLSQLGIKYDLINLAPSDKEFEESYSGMPPEIYPTQSIAVENLCLFFEDEIFVGYYEDVKTERKWKSPDVDHNNFFREMTEKESEEYNSILEDYFDEDKGKIKELLELQKENTRKWVDTYLRDRGSMNKEVDDAIKSAPILDIDDYITLNNKPQ